MNTRMGIYPDERTESLRSGSSSGVRRHYGNGRCSRLFGVIALKPDIFCHHRWSGERQDALADSRRPALNDPTSQPMQRIRELLWG